MKTVRLWQGTRSSRFLLRIVKRPSSTDSRSGSACSRGSCGRAAGSIFPSRWCKRPGLLYKYIIGKISINQSIYLSIYRSIFVIYIYTYRQMLMFVRMCVYFIFLFPLLGMLTYMKITFKVELKDSNYTNRLWKQVLSKGRC